MKLFTIKKIYGELLSVISNVIGINTAKKIDTKLRFGIKLDLENPKTLAEKVCYLELNDKNIMRSNCTDKYTVRSYIQNLGLDNTLVPLLAGPANTPDDIDFEELPSEYVLKATHGCGMNIIHTETEHLTVKEEKQESSQWLKLTYGKYSVEPHYYSIPHRLIVEQYLGDLGTLIDYKIHCYKGKPSFILACSERETGLYKLNCFSTTWDEIDCIIGPHKNLKTIIRPQLLDQMIEVSSILSQPFDFVRVDLYEYHNKIYFGELTFSPAACVFPYFSKQFQIEEGQKLDIEINNHE